MTEEKIKGLVSEKDRLSEKASDLYIKIHNIENKAFESYVKSIITLPESMSATSRTLFNETSFSIQGRYASVDIQSEKGACFNNSGISGGEIQDYELLVEELRAAIDFASIVSYKDIVFNMTQLTKEAIPLKAEGDALYKEINELSLEIKPAQEALKAQIYRTIATMKPGDEIYRRKPGIIITSEFIKITEKRIYFIDVRSMNSRTKQEHDLNFPIAEYISLDTLRESIKYNDIFIDESLMA